MKRVCFLFALVLILMTACTSAQPQSSQTSGDDLAWHQILVLDSLKDYEAYISTKRLPGNFVYWDSAAGFGSSIMFIPTDNFPESYVYAILDAEMGQIDENTQGLHLEITHNITSEKLPTSTKYQVLSVTGEMPDMRLVPSASGKSVIIRNGIQYLYSPLVSAKPGDPAGLNKITWYYNGVRFELTGNLQTFSSPLMHKLLSMSETEASAAFAEIKQSLDAN